MASSGSATKPDGAPKGPTAADTPIETIGACAPARALIGQLEDHNRVGVFGSCGSSTSMLAGAIARRGHLVVLITAHLDDADEVVDELTSMGQTAHRLAALQSLPGESDVSIELVAQRLGLIRSLVSGELGPGVVVACPIQALMQTVPPAGTLDALLRTVTKGQTVDPGDLVRWLDDAGYRRCDAIEEAGDFAVRGGIIDVFAPGLGSAAASAGPVRLDFFGDELDAIFEIDLDTMGSDRAVDAVELVSMDAAAAQQAPGGACALDLFPSGAVVILHELIEINEQARGYHERVVAGQGVIGLPAVLKRLGERFTSVAEVNQFSSGSAQASGAIDLPVRTLPGFAPDAATAIEELAELAQPNDLVVCCQNEGERTRLRELLAERAPGAKVNAVIAYLHRGFILDREGGRPAVFVPHHELFHRYQVRRRVGRIGTGRAMDTFLTIEEGDYVVHADHGVGKFVGLRTMERAKVASAGASEEFLTIEFARRSRLHVPMTQIDKVQRYVGGFSGAPPLSTIGGKKWGAQKQRVAEAVKDLAAEMLRVQAARAALPGVRYPEDTPWQKEFEAEFPYQETDDQLAALSEIKKDMRSEQPMDRLVCGDVGYGKTEVAIRAAFKAVEFGKQVAVLVPTTVLAEQHERTFRARFADYPFSVESLSRLKAAADQKALLKRAAQGKVDILIGTHRILSQDVGFADLGLVIVDEEQRFGVEHKQTLLAMRTTVDVLTLTATPIPRTLHMAMLGLRDISSLTTAPVDRRSIVTEVIPYNELRIRRAIARELAREGQVYFVHNRVQSIHKVADQVRAMAPDAEVVVGHGQMPPRELERVMLRFMRGKADILVCTTIIESGVDIPNANTMVITDADRFGLADLHQLRGRVGRYKHRAYCYVLLPQDRVVTEKSKKRLKAIEEFSMLGAGFKIAMRDLEIRGAGNLLGPEQSGHIATVGYEMYCRLLEDSVRALRNERVERTVETTVEIGVAGSVPRAYVPSDKRRMEVYRRLSAVESAPSVEQLERDLTQAYGEPPKPTKALLRLAQLRIAVANLGVRSVTLQDKDVLFRARDPNPIAQALSQARGTVRTLAPKGASALHEVYYRPPENYLEPGTLLNVLLGRLGGG
ncbi:MAG: transcription-repair coupling factor [Phycisphaeraceae bacterium]|nr:transcription-repair coupling factor [Phycisphaeraceae bacterium]MCB9847807.1 transcription-repair coupling factor [Phycisphaeraceae bacterium]